MIPRSKKKISIFMNIFSFHANLAYYIFVQAWVIDHADCQDRIATVQYGFSLVKGLLGQSLCIFHTDLLYLCRMWTRAEIDRLIIAENVSVLVSRMMPALRHPWWGRRRRSYHCRRCWCRGRSRRRRCRQRSCLRRCLRSNPVAAANPSAATATAELE